MSSQWKEFFSQEQVKKVSQNNVVVLNSEIVTKDQIQDHERTLQLRIELDSWSPIYTSPWGGKYREKLAPDIFKGQGPLESLSLNSYVDHDISIEKLIASTKDQSMKVYQEGNTILAEIKERKDDPLLSKVFDLVQRGVVTSNSFIFKSLDVDIIQKQSSDVTDVVFTKGELISIDPVYEGFYPQATTQIISKEKEIKMNEIKSTEKFEEELQTTETETEEIKEDKVESVKLTETTNFETVEKEQTKINQLHQARGVVANETVNFLHTVATKSELDLKQIQSKWLRKELLTASEKNFLKQEFRNLPVPVKEEIAMLLNHNKYDYSLVEKALDGASDENGLVLIETLTSSNVFAEMKTIFPELSMSTSIMPLIGLNEVKQPIMVPNSTTATSIAEGASSTELTNKVTQVTFKPTRYSMFVSQNNQLNNFNAVLEKQTTVTRNSIFRALRKAFYDNILIGIAADIDMSNYKGGATRESVVQSQNRDIQWDDLEMIYKRIVDLWGDAVKDKYMISMHVDTLTALEKSYFAQPSTLISQLYDPLKREFRGIKINATTYYPEKNQPEAHAVIFYLKEAVIAYGCNIVTQDDKITQMSEDQVKRYVRTRGEIKMCDPNLNTRVLKLAA